MAGRQKPSKIIHKCSLLNIDYSVILVVIWRTMTITAMTIQEYFQNYLLLKQLKFINFATDTSVQNTNERIDAVVQNILNYPSQNIGRTQVTSYNWNQILNRRSIGKRIYNSASDFQK
ncbi:Hypothetical_protein [Hexamita inflata]|uniref:Hypothetical_protein n=1 Tax=Hexamita inflata TaxID=28002 RepID=A0AA86PWJ4_9EUKA|nr:Hypothetical protein HINF_LOCUS33988 [Hexamita inflata]